LLIVTYLVSICLRPTKIPKYDLVPGSEEWFIKKIVEEHPVVENAYVLPWQLEVRKATAYLDYQWLGQALDGAPDSDEETLYRSVWTDGSIQKYPVRIHHKPHWLTTKHLRTVGYQEYFTWNFLEACALDNLPVSEESTKWRDWVGTRRLWLEQHYLLNKTFKKGEKQPKYAKHIQYALETARKKEDYKNIHDELVLTYPIKLPLINKQLYDWRPIPTDIDEKPIDEGFLKFYLARRIVEWLAAGGLVEWRKNWEYFVRYTEHPIDGCRKFIKPFYWDLWGDLDHLRWEYLQFQTSAREVQLWWRSHLFYQYFRANKLVVDKDCDEFSA
jgi:hypothetical protein